ncbi:putative mitochondrial protein [Vitis vinifera]|uniref:Putative mitochondrial protein n=1 Tax=Vitis vinifera TaxID=29760 RepID=A0A438ET93_VITVI|nr:putative mitochondrial protein [Vitis vinifera]
MRKMAFNNREKPRFCGFFRFWRGGDGLASGAEGDCFSPRDLCSSWERIEETQNKLQESKGMYRGERTYAEVVAEKGTRNGAGMPVGKWARAVVCEGKGEIRDWCEVGKAIARRVGMKGMVSVTPISAYKGCFFVENARKAQWFQERGSFTVRGEVFALRRWSPEENSVVRGKFRRGWLELRGLPFHLWDEVQLSHILQQWGRVTKVARNSLKFVDLSKVTLRVEMLPKVVLPALLEVEDGDWTYTVAVTVTGEDDGEDDGGDSISLRPVTAKDGCPVIVSILALQIQNRLRGRKEREVGAKDFGPIAGPAHKGSSNGGPAVSSSSKLQRPGLSAKNKASEGLPQVSSKTKGSPVSVRRRARSGPPRFDEASSSPKRSFEGGGSLETNRDISRGKSHSRKSDFSTGLETSKVSTGETEGEEGILQCKLINEVRNPISAVSERDLPLSGAFEPNLIPETSVSLVHPFCVTLLLRIRWSQATLFSVGLFLSLLWCMITIVVVRPVRSARTFHSLEGFQVEGLTPRKMVKVQSVLESLRVRIVRDNGKGVEGENRNPLSADKILSWNTRGLGSRKKRRTVRRFLSTQNPDVVMLQETKREIWDRRLVSSIWKGKSLDWVALPACGARGDCDLVGFMYGPNKAVWRRTFGWSFKITWSDFPKVGKWFVGPPLRNAAFTWSNMQVDPICKRFENMWLLHPEFKEKFRDWWQECTVEGWEGHKFMRKLKFIKSKLKEWNTRVFGDLRERKKHILTDLGRIDRIEQEGNLNLELVSERILRRKELEDLLLKEEVQWRQKSRVKWIKEGDCNSKFFHRVATGRRSRKFIKSLISERGETLNNIEAVFEEEVRMAVFQLNKEKAPGPDGFTLAVYQECWDVIKEDLMRVFFEFHTKGVLSGRLRKVLHETIFGSQGAFVEGRQILDAVLIANEVVDEKRRKGFSQKWRSWMRGCLSSSSFAILVNGNAKGWVKASRGLRQGDPLSPFLFTLVADVLSRLMIRAEETGITEGFLVGRDRTRVSLLQFADDTIFFSKASLDLLQNLKIILWFLGKVSEWPLSYLGLPLGGNPKTIGFWDPVVERISRRLDGWKKAYLSLGGRITLIQSCLSHIPSYFLSLFKIPVSIASKIEKMQRIFFGLGPGKGREIT